MAHSTNMASKQYSHFLSTQFTVLYMALDVCSCCTAPDENLALGISRLFSTISSRNHDNHQLHTNTESSCPRKETCSRM